LQRLFSLVFSGFWVLNHHTFSVIIDGFLPISALYRLHVVQRDDEMMIFENGPAQVESMLPLYPGARLPRAEA
jgi:hypothetical protein